MFVRGDIDCFRGVLDRLDPKQSGVVLFCQHVDQAVGARRTSRVRRRSSPSSHSRANSSLVSLNTILTRGTGYRPAMHHLR